MPSHWPVTGRPLAIVLVFSIFTNLLMLTGPLFMLQIYDRVLAARSEETLLALFLLVAGLYLLYWMLEFARARVMSRVGARLEDLLNGGVFARVLDRSALGGDTGRGTLSDVDALRGVFAAPVSLALMDIPWTPLFLALIFVLHPLLGWVAVAGSAILVVAALLNQFLTAQSAGQGATLQVHARSLASQSEAAAAFIKAQGIG